MKQAQFITLISENLRIEEKTVRTVVRFLREAGLFTTGARGVNAPDITALDAARVIIALVASSKRSKAVRDVKYFGQLKPDMRDESAKLPYCLDADTTLEETLVKCISNDLPYAAIALGYLELSEQGDALLRIADQNQHYHQRDQWAAVNKLLRPGSEEWKAAIHSWEGLNRVGEEPIARSARVNLEILHQIGFELIGWEVE